jgi:sulfofructose kinase
VVTAGASGCWWTDSPDRVPAFLPAFKVETFDTNGCGDTYHGAYALAIARDFSIADAVVFASACGALKAGGRSGGWNALPTASEVASFLHQRLASSDPGRPIIDRIGRSMVTI